MTPRPPLSAALVALTLTLGGCGGGASMPGDTMADLRDSDDPRVARLGVLLERADALLLTSFHARWSLAGGEGETLEDAFSEGVACAGARCIADDGTGTTAHDLLGPGTGTDLDTIEASVVARGGFDTATTRGTFEAGETPPGLVLTVAPEVTSYGFWGAHGFAALSLGAGALSADIDGTAFSGTFSLAQAYAAGDASGTNPTGTGGARWTGIVEATATGTFERLQGTATVTMADLARARVGIAIDVPGHDIGAPGWADMALADGRFSAGTAGTDHVAGGFHGPAHEEAWGVFDTAGYIGAFGAKRVP